MNTKCKLMHADKGKYSEKKKKGTEMFIAHFATIDEFMRFYKSRKNSFKNIIKCLSMVKANVNKKGKF